MKRLIIALPFLLSGCLSADQLAEYGSGGMYATSSGPVYVTQNKVPNHKVEQQDTFTEMMREHNRAQQERERIEQQERDNYKPTCTERVVATRNILELEAQITGDWSKYIKYTPKVLMKMCEQEK